MSGATRCPKCRSVDIATKWIGKGAIVPGPLYGYPASEEHLRRTCGNCGYYWSEPTADAEGAAS